MWCFYTLEECDAGKYGIGCKKDCGLGCKTNTCNTFTGHCECKPGWLPPLCLLGSWIYQNWCYSLANIYKIAALDLLLEFTLFYIPFVWNMIFFKIREIKISLSVLITLSFVYTLFTLWVNGVNNFKFYIYTLHFSVLIVLITSFVYTFFTFLLVSNNVFSNSFSHCFEFVILMYLLCFMALFHSFV